MVKLGISTDIFFPASKASVALETRSSNSIPCADNPLPNFDLSDARAVVRLEPTNDCSEVSSACKLMSGKSGNSGIIF